jgi:uncharacterized lipoprotein
MPRSPLIHIAWSALFAALVACSGKDGLRCEDSTRYSTSRTVPPIRVPDDLTVPDETESLLIPDRSVAADAQPPPSECLETPPEYFQNGADPG